MREIMKMSVNRFINMCDIYSRGSYYIDFQGKAI